MSLLLEVTDLAVSFRTRTGLIRAVDGVSFTIAEREILGIVGESGSGKSLTILAILDLIGDPNAVITGSIKFRDAELIGQPPKTLRSLRGGAIAMIFQDPMTALNPVLSIGNQIAEQIRLHTSLTRAATRTRVVELLEAVGLPDPDRAAARYPQELSGGQRQRAVIAMALSCNPALLLADEPTTALDVTVQAQILELIRALRRDFNSAIILITHNLGVVAQTADRVAVMYSGRIIETAPAATLFADPHHPYSWGLLGSIPTIEGARRDRLTTIPGLPPALDRRPPGCAFAPRCNFARPACTPQPPLLGPPDHQAACIIPPSEREADRSQVLAA